MATRRLPVIQEPSTEPVARPAWQWVLIGSGFLVTIWTPTVAVTLALARWLSAARQGEPPLGPSVAAGLVATTLALASLSAGYLVARSGSRTKVNHAVLAGLAAALEIWLVAWIGGAFPSLLVAAAALSSLALLGGSFCGLGGWLGRRNKSPL